MSLSRTKRSGLYSRWIRTRRSFSSSWSIANPPFFYFFSPYDIRGTYTVCRTVTKNLRVRLSSTTRATQNTKSPVNEMLLILLMLWVERYINIPITRKFANGIWNSLTMFKYIWTVRSAIHIGDMRFPKPKKGDYDDDAHLHILCKGTYPSFLS